MINKEYTTEERYNALIDYFLQIKQKEYEINVLKTKLNVLITTEEEKDLYETVRWEDFHKGLMHKTGEWTFFDDSFNRILIIEYEDIKIKLQEPIKNALTELFVKILQTKRKEK